MANKTNINFEQVFDGVYCFDAKELIEARKLHLAGQNKEAKEAYQKTIEIYEKELSETLGIKPKGSNLFISPVCVYEETGFEAGLKSKASASELAAKIYLAQAMTNELDGNDNREKISKAAVEYEKLSDYMQSLAYTCDEYEDIAKIMFESEAEDAKLNANILKQMAMHESKK
ncbi:hypothetical protein HYZ41_02005 [archaeon]|nr:hypothetical protein [archaeon]